jgi:AcrR family transcriptional regulator
MADPRKRPYRKRKRAQSEEETRQRITEAAVELHGTVGPAKTTLKEVAERAGVSRMTVYNHFPTDADLVAACSSHWAEQNPLPDATAWLEMDPAARLQAALEELYDWYGHRRGMVENFLRDAPLVPAVGDVVEGFWGGFMQRVVSALEDGTDPDAARHVILRVVVDFNTWRILDGAGLDARAAARVAADVVAGIRGP